MRYIVELSTILVSPPHGKLDRKALYNRVHFRD